MHWWHRVPWLLAIMLGGWLVLAGCTEDDHATTEFGHGYFTYRNRAEGFEIRYPEAWEMDEDTVGYAVLGNAPTPGTDGYRENVGVVVVYLDHPMSLDTYHARNVDALRDSVECFTLTRTGDTTLDDRAARWMEFTYTQDSHTLKCLEYEMVRDNRAYVVIATTTPEAFAGQRPLLQEIAYTTNVTYSDDRARARAIASPPATGPVAALYRAGQAQ